MLSRTCQLTRTQRGPRGDENEQQLNFIEFLKHKMELVLEQVLAEKAALEQRFCEQRGHLMDEIQLKNASIQKLQLRVRQLQGENSQIRYQHDQRLSLMTILKNQNALITKQFTREKEQIKQTLEALLAENRQLKHALIENQYREGRVRRVTSRGKMPFLYTHQFYSCKELRGLDEPGGWELREGDLTEGEKSMVRESLDGSMSKSSISGMLRNKAGFKDSRVTQIKGRSSQHEYQFGLQKMSTKTHLSRQRSGDRFD